MNEEILNKLYNNATQHFSMPDFETFKVDMQDKDKALKFRESMALHYTIPEPDIFLNDIGFSSDVKKKDTTEDTVSPSEDGLLVQPTLTPQPEPAPQEVSVVDDTTVISGREERGDTLNVVEPTPEGGIKPELIAKTEEYVVPELNYKYGDQGFVFEEADAFGDEMVVRAANGNTINVELDVFLGDKAAEAKKLNDFIEANKVESQRLKSMEQGYEADKIKFDSQKQIDSTISELNTRADEFNKKIQTYLKSKSALDEERDAIDSMSVEQKAAQSDYIKQYNERYKQLNKELQGLAKEEEGFKNREVRLNQAIGEYSEMKAEQGSWSGGIWNAINKGTSRIASGMTAYTIEAAVLSDEFAAMKPDSYRQEFARIAREKGLEVPENINEMSKEELRNYYSDIAKVEDVKLFPGTALMVGQTGQTIKKDVTFGELIEEKIYDDRIKEQKELLLPDIRKGLTELIGDKDTTEQWALAKQEGFWGGAILGLAESIPAMVAGFGGNWAKATSDMMMLTSDFLDEEMSGPEFDDVTEKEKLAFKLPVAIVSAVLETYGVRNVVQNSGLRNSILLRILRKPKKDLSGVPFQQVVKNEVDSMLGKGLLSITGAGLVEFETGAAQQAVEITAKEVFNGIKEKELFQTPESFSQGLAEVLRSGAQEAVGGFIMGVPGALSSAIQQKDFTTIDNSLYEMFKTIRNDQGYRKGFVQDIKNKINSGELTKEEGEKQIADYEEATALSNQIPVNTPVEQEKVLMGLLLRKKELTEEVEGKDPVLVEKQKQEIDEINNQIRAILETTTKETIKEEGEVEEKPSSLKTKVEKEQAVDIESFFGDEVEETTETVTDNLSINRSKKTKTKTAKVLDTESALIKIAQRGAKAVSKILPKTRIILHETTEEFEKFAAPGRGEYDPNADVIHVNLENALVTTVPHEIFHAVFLNKVKTDPAAAQLAETMMKSVRKALPATSELAKRIDTFAESYTDVAELQNEERLAELIGILSSEYKTLSKPNKNKVVKFIENLARQIGVDLKISEFTKTDEDVIDLLNTLAGKVATGEELVEADVQTLEELDTEQEQGSGGQVGTFNISPGARQQRKAPGIETDTRGYASLIQEVDLKDFQGQSFVTNMYDFTSAGPTEIAPGIILQLDGGKSYVPMMMERQGLKLGDKSNLAAFNSKENAESFARNAQGSGSSLFAPHVGTKEGSWQFQQNLLEQLTDAALNNNILTNKELINTFNEGLKSKDGIKAFNIFKKKLGKDIKNLNSFIDNPTSLIELLDINNNYSPDLRKILNDKLSANKKYQERIGVKNKLDFVSKFEDPLNKGSQGGDLVGLIEFDNNTFEIFKPKKGDVDYHPSFAYTIKANINGIYQPTDFYQSNDATESYAKYNKKGKTVSEKAKVGEEKFRTSNVSSSAGAIPKVGTVTPERLKRQQRATEEYISEGREAGFKDTVIIDYLSRVRKVPMKEIKSAMEIVSEGLGALPASFKNIQGGAKSGLKLFKKIDKLVQKEKKKKKPLADSQILEKAIEYMQRQPEYKNEADTYKVSGETRARKGLSTQQMLMEIDLQKTLGMRPTQDMSRKLGIARAAVKQRIKGIRDVQKVKTELKNFMRKALPARILLSRDAQKMFRYIERVTPDFMQSTQAQGAKIDNVFKEITDFVAEENNKILNKQIESILKGVYLKVVSNKVVPRKIDYKTQEKIEVIKAMLPAEGMTPEQINEVQGKLNEEFNKLAQEIAGEENPDESILDRMTELQIAISYSNALVQSNSDPIKTETLDNIYSQLQSLIEIGSSNLKLQIKNQAKEYRAQMAAMFYDITGVKLDPEDKNFKKSLKELENKRYTEIETREKQNRIKSAVKNVFRKLENTLFGTAESLTGLMNRISVLPGEMMGGISQTLVTEKINASSISYKKRMLAFDLMFQDKLKEYYGKNWKKKSREFRNSANTYKITEGRGRYNNLTQDQMYYLYNQYKDSASHPAFKNMFGEDYIKIMENLTKQLKPEVRKFADWQVNEYFPMVYAHYNEVYKDIYRTNMPQNQNYAGRIYRANTTPAPMNILGNSSTYNTQVSAASIMLREDSNAEIQPINGTDALVGYTREMEYFAAYAREVRDISKLFGNPTISTAIKQIHGQDIHGYITEIIEKISGQGMKYSIFDGLINKLTTVFVLARIGLSPLITIKQLTSALTYSNDIGVGNWLKYSAKNLPELRKVFKEISDNSVYMRDRGSKTILSQIETYANTNSPIATDWIPDRFTDYLMNVVMYSTRLGDRGAIYLGGSANYSYYKDQFKKKNPGATEQQAIDYAIKKFERDTKETQQSSDLQDKDVTQNSGALARSLNMFMTTPKQYLRKEIIASRNLYRKAAAWDKKAGKGTLTENFRQLVTYHAFMPMFFQWVSSGFPISDWDDEDTSDMMRALIVGNLNALFITGDLITTGADYLQGKPWYKETTTLPVFSTFTNILFKYDEYNKEKNPLTKAKKLEDFWVEFLMITGLPAKNLQKFAENYPKLSQSKDFPEFMLRLLNYSKYQIEGRPKKQGAKKKSMSMTEMKKFYPEMYEMIKDMEDPELKQLEKDMRELEKEMLESMYE